LLTIQYLNSARWGFPSVLSIQHFTHFMFFLQKHWLTFSTDTSNRVSCAVFQSRVCLSHVTFVEHNVRRKGSELHFLFTRIFFLFNCHLLVPDTNHLSLAVLICRHCIDISNKADVSCQLTSCCQLLHTVYSKLQFVLVYTF
jgi:hypothetical protein